MATTSHYLHARQRVPAVGSWLFKDSRQKLFPIRPGAEGVQWHGVSPEEFYRLVAAAYDGIPDEFRSRMENIAVMVESEPSAEQLARAHVPHGATLFGLYEGRPLTARSVFDSIAMPDRIIIFQGPHERAARSPEHLVKMVDDTVWHEVAHYFGMDESQVRSAERKRNSLR